MRPVAAYVEDVRALGRPVVAVTVSVEADTYSYWWDVNVVLEKAHPAASVRSTRGFDGRWLFEEYFIESPPDELDVEERKRTGSLQFKPSTDTSIDHLRDFDTVVRNLAVNLGQGVAAELGVPCYVNPPVGGGDYVDWWEQYQAAELGRLLRGAGTVVVVMGDQLSPIRILRPKGDEAALDARGDLERRWAWLARSTDALAKASPAGAHLFVRGLHERGLLSGLVVELGDGLVEAAGVPATALLEVCGSIETVRCALCRVVEPASPSVKRYQATGVVPRCACGGFLKPTAVVVGDAIENETVEAAARIVNRADLLLVLGSALDIDPYASAMMAMARRRVPYVLVNRKATRFDDGAVLAIDGEPSAILSLAVPR
jgi:NAD-dependent deacetylase